MAGLLAVVLISGFVVLTVAGASTTGYVLFCTGPLVSGIVGAVLSKKVADVQVTAERVEHATNGILGLRLTSLDHQLEAAHHERAAMDGYQGAGDLPPTARKGLVEPIVSPDRPLA